MGFLDRVKIGFNQALGDPASLTLAISAPAVSPGDTIGYRLLLVAGGPLKVETLTVALVGRERVRVWTGMAPGALRTADLPALDHLAPGTARENTTLQQRETVRDGELVLRPGQSFAYEGRIAVPHDLQPTYRGVDAQHTWRIRATAVVPLGEDVRAEQEVLIR